MDVGRLQVLPVADGVAKVPVADVLRFCGNSDDPFAPHRRFLNGDGLLELAIGGFLVRSGERVVVIDAGLGPVDRPPFKGGAFLDSLRAYGLGAEDVTDLVFTHLHFDHVGWATQQGRIVFPNATPRCHRADWAHFVDGDDPRAADKLRPLTDRMEFWDGDGAILPGIDVQGAPGHTPGSTIIVISDANEKAMLLGDVVHCPIELVEDDWEAVFDVDPALARRTREALSRELEGTDVPLAAAHFPDLRFGRLLPGQVRRGWQYG
jgi:glyoxylase-like metal-dependent hydrolase (beta-lactamase superfamily II)